MPRKRYDSKVSLYIAAIFIVLVALCLMVIFGFGTGEEASVGIFSLAVTLLGTLFIAVELKNGQNVTCSDMLIDLNNYFHDSDRLMKVYEVLEQHPADPEKCGEMWRDVKPTEVAHYCTFFENLYLLYRHHIAEIEDLDDLFGYRFFIFVNNPYIQENYILPTSSSYVQIFKLYEVWANYRRTQSDGRRIPGEKYSFPPEYFSAQLYMHDISEEKRDAPVSITVRGAEMTWRRLGFEDMAALMALQDECVRALPSGDLYAPLTRAELIESMHLDICLGVFSADGDMAAFAVLVPPRDSGRNLAHGSPDQGSTMTFDAVAVSPRFRGYGLQRELIDISKQQATDMEARGIMATVSPDNTHSLDNFLRSGFEEVGTAAKYGGLRRKILRYES